MDDRLTRRTALGVAGAAAATYALGALPAWARTFAAGGHVLQPDQLPFADRALGDTARSRIEHVVCVMMENHSLDNVLGMLPYVSPARKGNFDGLPANRRGIPISTNPDASGRPVRSFVLPDLCPAEGLTQNWNSSHIQYNNGRNNGFVRNVDSRTPMGYFTKPQMPVTYALAAHFPVSDRFFSSVFGQTLPNRRYYFSGTSSGQVNDDNSSLFVSAANGTIFDRLDAAKVPWHVYYGNVPSPAYFPNVRNNPLQVVKCVKNPQFFTDAANGKLPAVSYVEEDFNYQSEENPQNVAYGETFLRNVVETVMHGPLWRKTALFITYDEHGGYFDHVPPPPAIPPDNIPPDLKLSPSGTYPAGFNRYGFRVPLTLVSPWARRRYVSHKVADLASILAFIEHNWNLPPMTRRDARAWRLLDMFDFTAPRLLKPPALPAAPSIAATLAKCRADGKKPPTPPIVSARLPGF
jgi:phospholipase C